MKVIKVELGADISQLKIYLFADWHIGDRLCDKPGIKAMIEEVQNDPNAVCILMGDLCNNATKTSISDTYSEELSPMMQLNTLVEWLTPIKDKIVMVLQGNHEERTYRNDGIDLSAMLCVHLGIENRYAREGGVLFISFGDRGGHREHRKRTFVIYGSHGSGGGKREGGKAIRLADMASICDADIFLHAHSHLPFIMKEAYFRVNKTTRSVELVDKLFVNASAKLAGYGGYGQSKGFKPNSTDCPVIVLSAANRKMTAYL